MVETITLKTLAPENDLPGLDHALRKLAAIDEAIKRVSGSLSGLDTHAAFKRTAASMAEDLKAKGKAPYAPADVARMLGIPNPKDFQDYIANFNANVKQLKKASAEGRALSQGQQKDVALSQGLFESRGGVKGFASSEKAAAFTARYFRDALREARGPVEALQVLLGKGKKEQPSHEEEEKKKPAPPSVHVTTPEVPAGAAPSVTVTAAGGAGGEGGAAGAPGAAGSATVNVTPVRPEPLNRGNVESLKRPIPVRYAVTSTGQGRGGWIVQRIESDESGKETGGIHQERIGTKAEAKTIAQGLNEELKVKGQYRSIEQTVELQKQVEKKKAEAQSALNRGTVEPLKPPTGAPPPWANWVSATQPAGGGSHPQSQISNLKSEIPSTSPTVPVTVPASRIEATLGPGQVHLVIPPERVSASSPAAGVSPTGGGLNRGTVESLNRPGAEPAGSTVQPLSGSTIPQPFNGSTTSHDDTRPGHTPGETHSETVETIPIGKNVVRTKETTAPGKAKLLAVKEIESAGRSVETFWKEVEGGFQELKTVQVDEVGTRTRAKAEAKLRAINNELKGLMAPERGASGVAGASAANVQGPRTNVQPGSVPPAGPTGATQRRQDAETQAGPVEDAHREYKAAEKVFNETREAYAAGKATDDQFDQAQLRFENAGRKTAELASAPDTHHAPRTTPSGPQSQIANQKSQIRGRDPNELAAIIRKQMEVIEGAFKDLKGPTMEPLKQKVAAQLASMGKRAADLELRGADQSTRQALTDMRDRGRLRQTLQRAKERGESEAERAASDELKEFEAGVRDRNRVVKAKQKAESGKQKAEESVRVEDEGQRAGASSHAAALGLLGDLKGRGYTVSEPQRRGKFGKSGGAASETYEATRDEGGMRKTERIRLDFVNGQATGAQVDQLSRKLKETRAEAGALGGDFVKNTLKVSSWAASVGVLYKSIELARHSMHAMVEVSGQMARLDQVFRQTGGTTQELTSDILGLAAANGRSTDEAMEAGIRWSRLGLTRAQVNEAVRVSLIAANVAQIDANQATEHMSGIMAAYHLNVSDLRTVLAEMNSITNTWNVSNADMLDGLARTAAVAYQAKMPLAELMGLIGGGLAGTGQTGANIGNMTKSLMLALSNPTLQKSLRQDYQFEVTTGGGGELKAMNGILSELYLKYNQLNDLRRQGLLYDVAGKTQASRLAAALDQYVESQSHAILAQLNMNNADVENAKIKATLKSQLTGLITEWERFVVIQGQGVGGVSPTGMLSGMTESLHNVLKIMNTKAVSPLFTGLLAMGTAVGAKMALVAFQMKTIPGASGFVAKSVGGIKGAMDTLGDLFVRSEARMFSKGAKKPWWDERKGVLANTFQMATMDPWSRKGLSGLDKLGRTISGGAIGRAAMGVTPADIAMLATGDASAKAMADSLSKGGLAAKLFGGSLRALSLGLGLVRQFAVVGIAIWGFNKAMEGIGLSSEKAEAKLAGFNAEAQKAVEGAAAMVEAAKFMETMQRALPLARNDQESAKILKGVAEVSVPYEADGEARQAKVNTKLEEYLKLLHEENGLSKVSDLFGQKRLDFLAQAAAMRHQEYVENQRFMADNQREIDRLRLKSAHPVYGVIGAQGRKTAIAEREVVQRQKQTRQLGIVIEESGDLANKYAEDEKTNTALAKQKLALESISNLYHGLGANNRYEELGRELAMLEAQKEALQNQGTALKDNKDILLAGDDERRVKVKELEQVVVPGLHEAQIAAEKDLHAAKNAPYPSKEEADRVIGRKTSVVEEVKSKLREVEEVDLPKAREQGNSVPEERLRVMTTATAKEERETQSKIDSTRFEMESKRTRNIVGFTAGQEEAKGIGGEAHVGITDTEKLMAERQAMIQLRASIMQQYRGPMTRNPLTPLEHGEVLGAMNREQQIANDLRKRGLDLERDITQTIIDRNREFQKSVLGAGPSELLRKMAAFRMSQRPGGVTPGQFMAAAPNMRADLAQLNPRFDTHMMDLTRERSIIQGSKRDEANGIDAENVKRAGLRTKAEASNASLDRREKQAQEFSRQIGRPVEPAMEADIKKHRAENQRIIDESKPVPRDAGTTEGFVRQQLELSKAITEQMARLKDMPGIAVATSSANDFASAAREAMANMGNLSVLKELPGIVQEFRDIVRGVRGGRDATPSGGGAVPAQARGLQANLVAGGGSDGP